MSCFSLFLVEMKFISLTIYAIIFQIVSESSKNKNHAPFASSKLICIRLIYQNCVAGSLPSVCVPLSSENSMYFKASRQITELLEVFKKPLYCPENTWWYTLALYDEYAAIARKQISLTKFESQTDEFQLNAWRNLAACERQIIRYQAIINHMRNNLQCKTVATLIHVRCFFSNSMPVVSTIGGKTSQKFQEWLHSYSTYVQLKLDEQQLRKVPDCANRMVNEQDYSFSNELKFKIESRFPSFIPIEDEFTSIINEHLNSKRAVKMAKAAFYII